MNVASSVALAASIALAVLGYLAKYWNDVAVARRTDRLARVNRQLSEFYGPLYSLIHASTAAWHALWLAHPERAGAGAFWSRERPPSAEQRAAWHLWMRQVFMPLNRRMVEVIVEKADLVDGDKMPGCLLDLCAHVYAYEAVLKQWEEGDYTRETSVIPFPGEALLAYLDPEFARLKREQQALLGRLRPRLVGRST